MPISIREALQEAALRLQSVSHIPLREARWLLADILGQSEAWLHDHAADMLPTQAQLRFNEWVARRAIGYPLPYILGKWSFYWWDFSVNEHVLIPRPETEQLVERAYQWALQQSPLKNLRIVDVGTGSGVIALSLAKLLPQAAVFGVDVSYPALQVACLNAQQLAITNCRFIQGDLLSSFGLERPLDLVVANLPYIPSDDLKTLDVARYEPRTALDGGVDGLEYIRQLLEQLPTRLAQSGVCMLEIGAEQGKIFRRWSDHPYFIFDVQQDLVGRDRFVIVKFK
ncbi:MAG: peptide chain release factor N(5)-glutamine methyltransferase [Phototrophicales bacterium]|nr:MAG: peptide chain release factor N(5)-glutamine methyltransferase [Phototrophicales bacterium]